MSTNPEELPAIPVDPLNEVAERDTAGDPVKEILKKEGTIENKEDNS
jgi:hypothetical protein